MNILTVKIGGSILVEPESYYVVADKIARLSMDKEAKIIVVVSAMKSITDELLHAYEKRVKPVNVYERYLKAAQYIGGRKLFNNIRKLLGALDKYLTLRDRNEWLKPLVLSFGERISKLLLVGALQSNSNLRIKSIEAVNVIVTESKPDNARIIYRLTKRNLYHMLLKHLVENDIIVIEGYIGSTVEGRISTLGRGGSDYTATTISALLGIPKTYIYTDVPGILSGDPKYIPNPKRVPRLSFNEAYEASLHGVKKLHPRTFEPLIHIPRVKIYIGSLKDEFTIISNNCTNTSITNHSFKIITPPKSNGQECAKITLIGEYSNEKIVLNKIRELLRKHGLQDININLTRDRPAVDFYVPKEAVLPYMRFLHDNIIVHGVGS